MNSIKDLLDAAAPLTPTGTDGHDDLARGRALLRRHRVRQGLTAGTGLAVAATLAALVVPLGSSPPTGPAPGPSTVAATDAATDGATVTARPAVRLVAYTGEQPAGYTLRTIPEGWTVSEVSKAALVLAQEGRTPSDNWPDTILVAGDLNGIDLAQYPGKDVTVNGQPGRLEMPGPDGKVAASLIWTVAGERRTMTAEPSKGDTRGTYTVPLRVVLQLPSTVDWDEATVLRFAEGITVAPDADGGVG